MDTQHFLSNTQRFLGNLFTLKLLPALIHLVALLKLFAKKTFGEDAGLYGIGRASLNLDEVLGVIIFIAITMNMLPKPVPLDK